MGHVWIFQPDNNPNTNLKKKWVTEHKTKLLVWPFQSSDLNPVEHEWGELKRRNTNMELLFWQMDVSKSILEKGAVNCVQCVSEKNIYFVMIFIMTPPPPHFKFLFSNEWLRFLCIFLIKDQND